MAPIIKGYCTMTELKTGIYTLDEFIEMHEAIAEMAIKDKIEADKMKT